MHVKKLLRFSFCLVVLLQSVLFCGKKKEGRVRSFNKVVYIINSLVARAQREQDSLNQQVFAILRQHEYELLVSTEQTLSYNLLQCYIAMTEIIPQDFQTLDFLYAFGQEGVRSAVNLLGCISNKKFVYDSRHAFITDLRKSCLEEELCLKPTLLEQYRCEAITLLHELQNNKIIDNCIIEACSACVNDTLTAVAANENFVDLYLAMINRLCTIYGFNSIDHCIQAVSCASTNGEIMIVLYELTKKMAQPTAEVLSKCFNMGEVSRYIQFCKKISFGYIKYQLQSLCERMSSDLSALSMDVCVCKALDVHADVLRSSTMDNLFYNLVTCYLDMVNEVFKAYEVKDYLSINELANIPNFTLDFLYRFTGLYIEHARKLIPSEQESSVDTWSSTYKNIVTNIAKAHDHCFAKAGNTSGMQFKGMNFCECR